jgi:hypothetical protein
MQVCSASSVYIETLIGNICSELLTSRYSGTRFTWEIKPADFQAYDNYHRTHSSLGGHTPAEAAGYTGQSQAKLDNFRWHTHCKGLYQFPAAA